jgi:hypothetical protein
MFFFLKFSIVLNVRASHWRRYKNDSITSDEEHGDVPLGRPVHLFVRFLVDLHSGHGLLHVSEDHVQMLIVCLNEKIRNDIVQFAIIFDIPPSNFTLEVQSLL